MIQATKECFADFSPLDHFSENSGWITIAPIFGGNAFTVMFGRILDAHTPEGSSDSDRKCLTGRECYNDVLYVAAAACVASTLLVGGLGWRDRQKIVRRRDSIHYREGRQSSF